jgi:hypothetical protein
MTDLHELNIETLCNTLRKRASGMRQLASEIRDEEFRSGLLALAQNYDRKAETLQRGAHAYRGYHGPSRKC